MSIKKFIGKMILAFIPFLLYIMIFVMYEPYNYWGVKSEKNEMWYTPLAKAREFMRNPSENVILGDSRMLHFDLDVVEEETGLRYANLATGGQSPGMSRRMYEWAKERTDINHLIIDASFWQVRTGNEAPSVEPVLFMAENPLLYIVTRDYVQEAFELFMKDAKKLINRESETVSEPETGVEKTVEGKYREDLITYAVNNILRGCSGYSIGGGANG